MVSKCSVFRMKFGANILLIFIFFVPFRHFGQSCKTIGIKGQKIEIERSGSSLTYTGLAFEFVEPDSKMIEFQKL